MKYTEFRAAIQEHLAVQPQGNTWAELRDLLALPYERPCPTWVARLEGDIGLDRREKRGRSLVWKLAAGGKGSGRA